MAPKQKRPSPLDDPPSDSEEEDQRPSSQQQRPNHSEEEDDEEEEEEEEEASSEEQEEHQQHQHQPSRAAVQPASKTPPPQQPANSHPKPTSSSDTESESATESDSEPDPPPPKLKPLASTKPNNKDQQTPKLKPHSSPAVQAKTASSKRPAENSSSNNSDLNDPKRAKKKVAEPEDTKKSSRDDSKKIFQRLFSEGDDIAILKGMVEFSSKTRGKDPLKCAEEFHDFMKRSKPLSFDASCNQLKEKIRRLKKKFENNAGKGKNGEGPSFSKPHEKEAFELSKKVWGSGEGNGEVEKAKPEKRTPKKESGSAKSPAKAKPKPEAITKPDSEMQLAFADSKESGKTDELRETNLALTSMMRFEKCVGLWGLGEDFVRERVELIEASKREELEGKWRKLQDAELELYAKRAELYAEQARLMLQANKSSRN